MLFMLADVYTIVYQYEHSTLRGADYASKRQKKPLATCSELMLRKH